MAFIVAMLKCRLILVSTQSCRTMLNSEMHIHVRHRSLYSSPHLCACLTESEVCLYALPVSLNLHCVFGGTAHIFGLVLTNDGRNQMCFPFRILTLWLAGFFDGDFDVALPTNWSWIAVVSMSLACCTEEAS